MATDTLLGLTRRHSNIHIQRSFMLNLYLRLNCDFSITIGSGVIFLAWMSILNTLLSYLHDDLVDARICQTIYQLKCTAKCWNIIKLCPVKQRNCCEIKADSGSMLPEHRAPASVWLPKLRRYVTETSPKIHTPLLRFIGHRSIHKFKTRYDRTVCTPNIAALRLVVW